MKLRFFAVEGLDSYSPPRVRLNKIEPIGKVRNADGAWVPDVQPATVVLGGDELQGDWQYLRKDVVRGHVLVADEETAKLLEVPWDAAAVATRVDAARAAEDAAAKAIETLESGLVGFARLPTSDPSSEMASALPAARPNEEALPPAGDSDKRADTLPPPPPDSPAVTPAKAPSRRKET